MAKEWCPRCGAIGNLSAAGLCQQCGASVSQERQVRGLDKGPRKMATKDAPTRSTALHEEGPEFQYLGMSFTESQYELATRHNRTRWILVWVSVIPLGIVMMLMGYDIRLIGLVGVGVAITVWALVTPLLPGCKDHGSAIYAKYKAHREFALEKRQTGTTNIARD